VVASLAVALERSQWRDRSKGRKHLPNPRLAVVYVNLRTGKDKLCILSVSDVQGAR
jgi:hypothetical protein